MKPIPAFLISFNRGTMLERAIAGLLSMAQPTQIIVHDNGSTDVVTLEILERLSGTGIKVVYRKLIHRADELNLVNETVQDFFSGQPSGRYIVSDCDVDIGIADPRALALYAELLDLFPDAECVGPMLRIQDVPPTYPLFNRMMNRHIDQFWKRRPSWTETSLGRTAYIAAPIDTTMALHREGTPFSRLKQGLRIYEPYEAKHLDWYLSAGEMDAYSETSSSNISHWNNAAEQQLYGNVSLEYSHYYAVRVGPEGIEEYIEALPLNQQTSQREET